MSRENLTRFRFGHWEADIASGELFKSGRRVHLQRQPFKVLETLLRRAGQVVTREELGEELWPGTNVEVDLSLNTALKKLRAVLGDNSRLPIFIETIPKQGYRFLQKSQILDPETTEDVQRREFSGRPAKVRLAVLPFENLDTDGKDHFSDGLSRHILALCAGLDSSITMVATPSVIRYRHTSKSTSQLCRELKANCILTGGTLRSSHIVRVDVNLINADQSCVWSHSYTYSELDLLRGQDQISEHIVRSIAEVLSPSATPKCIISPAAEDDLPQANHILLQGTGFCSKKRIELFQQATTLDAGFAPACCGLDSAFVKRGWLGVENARESFSDASCAAQCALDVAFTVDSDIQILTLNCAAARFLGKKDVTAVLGHRAGEVFRCLHSAFAPEGCGRAPRCQQCVIRNSVTKCMQGRTVNRARTRIDFLAETNQKPKELLITASCMPSINEPRALLIIEDITQDGELEP
jgi:DNA-binding winged helix-turn-helix (wHTH) protein